MITNRVLVSLMLLAGVLAEQEITATSTVAAGTNFTMQATHIYIDGKNVSNPQHVIAKDPWSGLEAAWIPMNYVQQTLKQLGFQTAWNGTAFTFVKYPSGWKSYAALGDPEAPPALNNQIQINLVNGAPPSEDIPKLVARDPVSGVETTYAPIFYVNQILNHYWRMGATWNGTHDNWILHSQQIK